MSRDATRPSGAVSRTVSPSSSSMASKSAFPTPTMIMDRGSLEAFTIACNDQEKNKVLVHVKWRGKLLPPLQ